jgi:hypothetical protein
MKRLWRYIVFSALFLICCSLSIFGQQAHRWEVGSGIGASGYLGDLNKSDLWSKEFHLSNQFFVRKYIGDFFAFRYNFQFGHLSGRDSYYTDRVSRNLSVQTIFIENTLLVEWDFNDMNPLNYRQRYGSEIVWSPYFFAGIGTVYTNPKVNFDESETQYTSIREGIEYDRNAQYSRHHVILPFGGGLKCDISPDWCIGIEATFRIAMDDYVDGVSRAANSSRTDGYQMGTLTITRRIGMNRFKIRRKW